MKGWENLGVVDTIYEEEYEYSSSSSPSLSPSPSSPPATLHSRVQSWSLAKGRQADVLIRIQGTCFHLHKDPLTSKSPYLKRQLTDQSELILSPPLKITAHTFSLVADFCYGARIAITPFNVAALRTAAELLQMTETNGDGEESLRQIAEAYFRQIVAMNREYALIVFRSGLSLLPEAETTACLVSRCIEALRLTDEGYGIINLFDEVVKLDNEDFKIVAESMSLRLTSHDVIYEIVDLYLKEQSRKISEEQKAQLCNNIDCNKLSSQFILHAVQNPRMPLRFIIQAMLAEQLHTRRSIYPASNYNYSLMHHHAREDPVTLGAILERDAALREAAQLKAEMSATSLRIQSLENELSSMKKRLNETEKERILELNDMSNEILRVHDKERSILESGRSASFHYGKGNNKIERGERGSVSSLNIRFGGREERAVLGSSSLEGSRNETSRIRKNVGLRLISGLKSAFRASKPRSDKEVLSRVDGGKAGNRDGDEEEDESFMVITNDSPSHKGEALYFLR